MSSLSGWGLVKRYGGRWVLSDVSMTVNSGEIVGLLGPNGAGKTTCFYIMVGLVRADRGQVWLGGEDISRCPMHVRARRGLSYLPQESSIFSGLTVLENVLAVLEIGGVNGGPARRRAMQLLEDMGVSNLAEASPQHLSGGERRRVEIARLLATNPSFVLLDEPFAAIEPIAVRELQDIIFSLRARNIGVFITDHHVRETLKICDRAYIVDAGKVLAEGSPADIIGDEAVRKAYLGAEFSI